MAERAGFEPAVGFGTEAMPRSKIGMNAFVGQQ
jgi:hypothetical protein